MGDLNQDDRVTAGDAADLLMALARMGAGMPSGLSDAQLRDAEVNGDGEVNAGDANEILRYAAYNGAGGTLGFVAFMEQHL